LSNRGYDGAGLDVMGRVTLTNAFIADNQLLGGGSGSGIAANTASLRATHTTLARNTGGDGSGLYVISSTVALTNTILVSHSVGIYVNDGDTASLEATLWGNETDWAGEGTIITGDHNYWGNPAFVDPDAGDYHLTATSLAIDVGVDAGVTTDIDGESRPMGLGFDLGADEYPGLPANRAPYTPSDPVPADGSTDVPTTPILSWQGGDPDGDPVAYTVAFGTSDPPPVVAQVITTTYEPGPLDYGITYYWIITASDGLKTSAGPTWSFSTAPSPCTQITDVALTITNPGALYTDTLVIFQADLAPDQADPPYHYRLTVDGSPGQVLTATTQPWSWTDSFPSTGTHSVHIAVWNCQMDEASAITDVVQFEVYPPGECIDLEQVAILGPSSGYPGIYTFTTHYTPTEATPPIDYLWDDDGTGSTSVRSLGVGTHTLNVAGQNFNATITQGPTPSASFSAQPSVISSGQSSTLSWSVTAGTYLDMDIDQGVAVNPGSTGQVVVSPTVTTTYNLVVVTKQGGVDRSVTVYVDEQPSDEIFSDGFNSGDTSAWSATVGG